MEYAEEIKFILASQSKVRRSEVADTEYLEEDCKPIRY